MNPVPQPISFPFGWSADYPENGGWHGGVDYACPIGTPGSSRVSGRVVISEDNYPQATRVVDDIVIGKGYWGSYIEVQAADGSLWGYCHLSERLVGIGAQVVAGEIIYKTGDSGRVYGSHLHEHHIVNGRRINPLEEEKMARTAEQQLIIDFLRVNATQRLEKLRVAAVELGLVRGQVELGVAISEINEQILLIEAQWPA